jgi:coniferyl-aldehyde dehydrogenase
MSLLQTEETTTHAVATGTDDSAAIGELRTAFEAQRRAFAADRQPSLAERRKRLERIVSMMLRIRM